MSTGFILEEGLPLDQLGVIATSMECARAAGVTLVTGDTKVVDKGHGDGVFINTSGFGLIPRGCTSDLTGRSRATWSSSPGPLASTASPS
ncbi:MAG: hypothetical protein R2851_04255 [Caldilineaceae bacterium]